MCSYLECMLCCIIVLMYGKHVKKYDFVMECWELCDMKLDPTMVFDEARWDKKHKFCAFVVSYVSSKGLVSVIPLSWQEYFHAKYRGYLVFTISTKSGNLSEKPLCGSVKINVDATVFNNKTSFGVIIRDFDGLALGRGGGFKDELMTIELAELYAFEEGLKLAHSLYTNNAIFETDCASLMNRFKKYKDDITIVGHRIEEI
ncbi:hypothetical protein Gotur_031748 [Gossypium turneri]